MNRKTLLLGSFAALTAAFGLASCDQGSQAASSTASEERSPTTAPADPAAAPASAPDEKRILARSAERWDHIAHGDWIQAYDYNTPERKQVEKLGRFLEGKDNHDYQNPSKPRLVAIDGDTGYASIEVVWTPMHPEILGSDNMPSEGMTEILAIVETWVWQDGEWFWVENTRRNEFFRDHPEYADANPAGGAKEPGAEGGQSGTENG